MTSRGPLAHLEDALAELDARGLRRRARPASTGVSFCSNDYLGLAHRAADGATGAGASRLVDGERPEHELLERAFADHLGVDSCLAFTSGYAANVGTLAALAGPGDLVVSDALNHASLIDGIRLSRANVVVVPHNDVAAVAAALAARSAGQRAWVVVESYYSMDADGPDLASLRSVCDEYGAALVVDEAHALGVLGPNGRGRLLEAGLSADVVVATLGKSFGSQGAVVGGPAVLREWLWNRARSFIFSTGLSPACAAAGRAALLASMKQPELAATTLARAEAIRGGLADLGLRVIGFGHVIPVIVGTAERAVAVSRRLAEHGIDVPAIRPPTVPDGTARLRVTASARQTNADVERLLAAFRRL